MNRCSILCVLSAFIVVAGCNRFTPVTKDLAPTASLTLYEGLPHQSWEAELLEKELEAKKTITVQGFPFYERPLVVTAADVAELRGLSAAPDTFSPYRGPKMCGGFHPDYCLSWQDGETKYELLICFGCHEMKFFAPNHEAIADIQAEALARFEAVLKKYRDQRPK